MYGLLVCRKNKTEFIQKANEPLEVVLSITYNFNKLKKFEILIYRKQQALKTYGYTVKDVQK